MTMECAPSRRFYRCIRRGRFDGFTCANLWYTAVVLTCDDRPRGLDHLGHAGIRKRRGQSFGSSFVNMWHKTSVVMYDDRPRFPLVLV